jgi:nitrogen fixation protein NifU and related proteins
VTSEREDERAGGESGLAPAPGAVRPRAHPYGQVIRERWRRPRFRGELPGARLVAEDVNPLCGDRVRMMVELEDGRVGAARFTGDSCAICTASADVLAELATGRPAADAARLATEDVLAVLETDIRPTRMRCVTLPVGVLRRALRAGG